MIESMLTRTKSVVVYGIVLLTSLISSCGSDIQLSYEDCITKITGITEMPFKDDMIASGIYHEVLGQSGDPATTECLLSQITNLTPTPDPRASTPGPHPQLVIGDVSVFMLSRMYDIPFTSFIEEEAWSNKGIFAYYEYTGTDGARENIADIFRKRINSKLQ